MTTTPHFPALTDEQRETFEALTSGTYGNFALMSAGLDMNGVVHPVSVVVAYNERVEAGEDVVESVPLAVLVDEHVFDHLVPPSIDGVQAEIVKFEREEEAR